jgi:DNA repair exonuclease SbcCD ATPase subunit
MLMFSEINARLVAIKGELRKTVKYQVQLADYEFELKTIEQTIEKLHQQFEREQLDVKKLESISLTNLFASLAGTKAEKLSREKQELMIAQHKLTEAEKTKTEIKEAINELREKLDNIENAKYEYQQLLIQKEQLIKENGLPAAARIFELMELEASQEANLTELKEAIDAGNRVKSALGEAMKSLDSASSWGTFDMWGGGTIAGMKKHQHIHDAEGSLHRAQTRMRQFQKELLDINQQASIDIEISEMLKFADFFFDGFLVDYMVQNKINRAVSQTETQYGKVNKLLVELNRRYTEDKKKIESIQKEKQDIIENL